MDGSRILLGDARSSPAPSVVTYGGAKRSRGNLTAYLKVCLCRHLVQLLTGGGRWGASTGDGAGGAGRVYAAAHAAGTTFRLGEDEGFHRSNAGVFLVLLQFDGDAMLKDAELMELLCFRRGLLSLPFRDERGGLPSLEVT